MAEAMWFLTAISLFGNFLNCNRKRECFILWICCNIGWMIIDIIHGTHSRAVLDVVQTAFAFYGYRTWSTAEKPKKESGDG